MPKRILVGLGGSSYSSVAIRRAVELAQFHEAQLTAVTVFDIKRLRRVGPIPIGAGAHAMELRKHRLQVTEQRIDKVIGEFEDACNAGGVSFCVRRETGDPFHLMPSCARRHDLMIFGLRSIFDYGILGDADYKPCDTLTRFLTSGNLPLIASAKEYRPIQRVMIAYSGSTESAKTMKRFVQFRLWPEMKLRVVTFQQSKEKGEQLCAEADEYCRAQGVEAEVRCYLGKPKKQLLCKATDWQTDMIVLGSSTRSLLLKKLFGETSLHVIRNTDCSLYLDQ